MYVKKHSHIDLTRHSCSEIHLVLCWHRGNVRNSPCVQGADTLGRQDKGLQQHEFLNDVKSWAAAQRQEPQGDWVNPGKSSSDRSLASQKKMKKMGAWLCRRAGFRKGEACRGGHLKLGCPGMSQFGGVSIWDLLFCLNSNMLGESKQGSCAQDLNYHYSQDCGIPISKFISGNFLFNFY